MDILKSTQLTRGSSGNSMSGSNALAGKEVVGLYFSAHWCPPCRQFTPLLKEFYETLVELECAVEIVFVSSDQTPEAMGEYMSESHGDWLAVSHGSEAASKLSTKFQISGIPALIFLHADGSVLDKDGRSRVMKTAPTVQAFQELAKH